MVFTQSCASLTFSISTLSAWSKVVRLWRSFIASRSSASLRSSIRRRAASSRLQGGESGRGDEKSARNTHPASSNQVATRVAVNILSSRPEWFDGLLPFASTSRWKVQRLYGWVGKYKMVNAVWFLYIPAVSANVWTLVGAMVSHGPFSLCLSISRSFSLLICCSRRRSSASCWLLRTCSWAHWWVGMEIKAGQWHVDVHRSYNGCNATHFGLFTSQHVLKPGHVLIHLNKLLLRDKSLLFPHPPRMTSTHSFHFLPTLSASPCCLCTSLSATQEALWDSSFRGWGLVSLSR